MLCRSLTPRKGQPGLPSAATPVFDSPSTPGLGTPDAEKLGALAPAATPPAPRRLFQDSPGSRAEDSPASRAGSSRADEETASESGSSAHSADDRYLAELAESAAEHDRYLTALAAADERHEQRLQVRAALADVNETIAALQLSAELFLISVVFAEREDWLRALDAVDDAILELESEHYLLPETMTCYMVHRAGCQLKLELPEAAARSCTYVLEALDPDNVNALYRRGCALAYMQPPQLEAARVDFGCAASLSPSSHPAHRSVIAVDRIMCDRQKEIEMHERLSPASVWP